MIQMQETDIIHEGQMSLLVLIVPGCKVGRMTRTVWVTWVTVLVGQMGFICKLNYLYVTRILHVL